MIYNNKLSQNLHYVWSIAFGVMIAWVMKSDAEISVEDSLFFGLFFLFLLLPITGFTWIELRFCDKTTFMGQPMPKYLKRIHNIERFRLMVRCGMVTGVSALITAGILGSANLLHLEFYAFIFLSSLYMHFIVKFYEKQNPKRRAAETEVSENGK